MRATHHEFAAERPYADPAAAAGQLVQLAASIEPVHRLQPNRPCAARRSAPNPQHRAERPTHPSRRVIMRYAAGRAHYDKRWI